MGFKFSLGQKVKLALSGEEGAVVGRAEYTNSSNGYFVRYKAADGAQRESWWNEDGLVAADAE